MVYSSARPGPLGGPQGGVAIIYGSSYKYIEEWTLAQGCGVEVVLEKGGKRVAYCSIYLPPDDRIGSLDAIVRAPRSVGYDCYVMGDLNFDFFVIDA